MSKKDLALSENTLIWLLAAVQFINVIDFMMIMPLGPDLAKGLGMNSSDIGSITAAYTFSAATAAILSARFIDRFRRKAVLTFTLLGLSIGTLAAAFSQNTEQLIACRVIAGGFAGPATSIAMSLLIDHIPVERRGRAMGKVMGAFSVAAVLGVPTGMQLSIWFSWHAPFLLIGSIGLIVSLLISLILPKGERPATKEQAVSLPTLLAHPGVMISYLMTAGAMLAGFLLIPNFSSYFQFNLGFPREDIGSLYLVGGIASFFSMRIAGQMVDRFGSTPIAWAAWLSSASIVFVAFILQLQVPLWLVFIIFMSANATRNVAIQALASQVPPAALRGAYMSLQSATRHISTGLAASIASMVLSSGPDARLQHFDSLAWLTIFISILVPIAMHLTQHALSQRKSHPLQ
ncbi:putative MFS family arabinose efflux permease [Sinobacterium caligoides]|uniref:Putative MFS family arabinose efflux permease n=1 Tax=Sinobacterium caligoides TaxID=933926 RepID=A0A3N2DP73_9GAMM|nr:MFS transporter [Sinobacterium caligoides]ROS01566.1 putative MFS family arabinose efflux permease [Sinobacterium caligoides]